METESIFRPLAAAWPGNVLKMTSDLHITCCD